MPKPTLPGHPFEPRFCDNALDGHHRHALTEPRPLIFVKESPTDALRVLQMSSASPWAHPERRRAGLQHPPALFGWRVVGAGPKRPTKEPGRRR
jgi:hypothetical protein